LIISDFPNLKEINLNFAGVLSSLEITECPQLESLDCQGNNLITHLDLSQCNQLERVWTLDNRLESIRLPDNSKKLSCLVLSNNNFPHQNLEFLRPFTNLKHLGLGTRNLENKELIKEGIYNKFYGSLEPLKNMNKLKTLDIDNTDIDSGLEHLVVDNLFDFTYSAELRPESKVAGIYSICGASGFLSSDFDKKKLKGYQESFRDPDLGNQY